MKKKNSKDHVNEKIYFTLTAFYNVKWNAQKVLTEILKIDEILENWL